MRELRFGGCTGLFLFRSLDLFGRGLVETHSGNLREIPTLTDDNPDVLGRDARKTENTFITDGGSFGGGKPRFALSVFEGE